MVNLYKVKVYAALIISPLLTVLSFVIVAQFYGFLWGLAGMFAGIMISVLISKLMIRNAYSLMLEGHGVLVHNIDSTGIMRPFIVQVQSPYIKNKKEDVNDVFDRNAVYHYAVPMKARKAMELLEDGGVRLTLDKTEMIKVLDKKSLGVLELKREDYRILEEKKKGWFGLGGLQTIKLQLTEEALSKVEGATKQNLTVIELSAKEYNDARFALFHYPALIWNDQIKSMLTKDFLAGQEKEAFAEHNVLYLNRKMEELTSVIRDFGRYVVELTKPKSDWFQNKWAWIIIAIVVIILIALFAPSIITAIKGASGAASGAVKSGASMANAAAGTITPVG